MPYVPPREWTRNRIVIEPCCDECFAQFEQERNSAVCEVELRWLDKLPDDSWQNEPADLQEA